MPKTTVYSDLNCYGKLITSGIWGGVSLQVLLAETGYTTQTANLQFYASDGYTTTLTLSDDTSQDVILAYELEGSTLPEVLRLVIPNANGEGWIAMIISISINSPTYPASPNPAAAQIIIDQSRLQQPSTIQTSPTPEPKVQPTPQPTIPQTTNQPAQRQDSLSSNIQKGNIYPIIIGTIAAASVTIGTGCLFYKLRKQPKTLNQ